MPYATNQSLPKAVRQHLPPRGQSMWRKVFNSASRQYKGEESKAFATAWAAVKKAGYDPPPEYDMPAGAHVLDDLLAQDAVTINGWTLESLRELLDHHPDEFPLIWEPSERDDFAHVHVAGDEEHPVELREIGGDAAVTFSRRPHTRIVTPSWRAAVGLAAEALHHGPRVVASARPVAADVLVLSYVPEEGVLLRGPTKENKDAIKKTNLFRYSRNLPRGASWYVQRSRGRALSREQLESYASALRRAGAPVEVEFEGKRSSAAPGPAAVPSPRSASRHSIASARLRDLADSMEVKADQEIGAQRLENTPRRAAMASGIRGRAEQQKALAQVMRRAADAIDSGADYQHVSKISTRADIEALDSALRSAGWDRRRAQGLSLSSDEQPEPEPDDIDFAEFRGVVSDRRQLRDLIEQTERIRGAKDDAQTLRSATARLADKFEPLRSREVDAARNLIALSRRSKIQLASGAERIEERVRDADRFARLGIVDTPTLQTALREYFGCCRGKVSVGREDPMKKRLRDLQFAKIPGFFATPPELAARVAELADVQPGMRVLEPSAGSGSLALAVLEREPAAHIDAIERNLTLRSVLEDRGLRLVSNDFTEFDGGPYDRIVMNPPFEERQDTKHIDHALNLLAPGGRLVAIASGSFPSRSDSATVNLRDRLEEMGATIEPLPAGSFKESGTDVSTVLIVADKPGSAPAFPRQARPSLLSADEPEPPSDPIVSADNFEVRKIVGYRVRLRDGVYGDVEGWGIWDRSTGGWVGSERTFAIGPKATASAVVPMSFDLKRTAELAIKDGLIAGYPVVGYSDPTGWSRTASVKIEPDQPARPVGLPPGAVSIFDLDKSSKSEPATQEAPAMVERTQPGSLFSIEDEGFALVGQRGAPVGRFVPPQGEQIGLEGVSRKPSSEKLEEIAREERARGPVEESTGPMFASSMTPERLAAIPVDLSRYRRPSSTVGGIFGGFGDRALHEFLAAILAKDHPAGHARARARGMWDANELDKHAAYLAIAEALEAERSPAYPELAARQARPSLSVPSDQVVLTYTPVAGILLSGPTKPHKEKIKAARAGKLSFRWSPKSKGWYVPRSSAGRSGQPIPRADIEALARALSDMGVPVRIEINGSAAPVAPAAPAAPVELPPGLPAVPLDPAVQSRLIKSNPRKAEAESLALVPAYSPTDYRWHVVYIYTGGIEPSRSYATKIGGHTIVAKPPSFLGGFWTLNIDGQRWGERGRDKFEEAAHDLTRWVASQSWPAAPLVSPRSEIAVEVVDEPGEELPTAHWRADLLRVYNPKTRSDDISVALAKDGHPIYGDDGLPLEQSLEFGINDASLQRVARKLADAMFEAIESHWPDLSPSRNSATLNARTRIYGTDVSRFEALARKSTREAQKWARERQDQEQRMAATAPAETARRSTRWEGEIRGKRVQLAITHSTQRNRPVVEVYREYDDQHGLFEFLGHFDTLTETAPAIASVVVPLVDDLVENQPASDSKELLRDEITSFVAREHSAGRLPGHGVGRPETSTRKWPDTAPSEPPPPKLTPREQREQKRTERNAARREREREKKEAAEREREAKRQARRDRDQAKREAESQEKGRAAERRLEREQARVVENAKRRIKPAECACRRAREGVRVASAAYEVARTKLVAAESVPETCSTKPTTSADRRARARKRLDDATAALDKARAAELAAESRLAELRALAGEVAPPSPAGVYGLETLVVVPSARGTPRTIPARYVLVDAERIIPSHDATTFEPRPDYPPATQERKYEKSQAEQLKVQDVARNMIPQLVQNTNAGAVDGTPIVDQSMIVLSGNGRSMGVQRHYRTNHHDLHAWLADNAAQFGFTRADVLRNPRPLVVREVSVDPKDRARLVRDFNEGLTQRLDVYDELAAKSRQLPPDVLAILRDGEADKMGLKSFLASPSASRLIFALEQSGFINRANRTRMLRGADHLSPEAQREVGSLLSSAVVAGDVAPFLRHMMDRSAAAWLVAAAAGEGWDVRRQLGLAVVELGSIRSADQCLVRWRQQSDLSGPRPTDGDPMARALLELLVVTASSPARFEAIARGFAERSREGGGGLFAAPVDPVEALRESAAAAGMSLESAESKTRCRKRRKS